MKPRIAIDLDLTLGEVILHDLLNEVLAFRVRPGCLELLERLRTRYTVCLWTMSSRWYLRAVLLRGLAPYFDETYAGDEIRMDWKDIRRINVEYLIDDSEWHRNFAVKDGLDAARYILVPPFGSREDDEDPTRWVRLVEEALLVPEVSSGAQSA
jgi:hypothetical protein